MLLIVILLVFAAGRTMAQQQPDSMLAVYQDMFPKEKIHIHFDRSVYNREETIWYKVYLLAGSDLLMSGLSTNMYLEWYDASGKMIRQTVAPLFQSTAKGSFDVPADYKGNMLRVKAYTRWMLNDDSAFIYQRDIAINNTRKTTSAAAPVFKTKVEAFPEGGALVEGLRSRIAFKATNQYGTPVFVKAVLLNDKNKVLDTLKVKHDGMGSFNLQPKAGESYTISWTDPSGAKGTSPVPVAKKEGAVLSISTTNDKAIVNLQRTANIPENMKQFHLLAHMNQLVYYTVAINMTNKTEQIVQLPIEELSTGILQFTLFTSDWLPVAERIAFINNHLHEFNARITPQIIGLDKRSRNVIEVFVSDTLATNMSISVTDAAISTPDEHTIFSDFLLSDDIRGKVHNPAYYFTSDADSVTANLDLVMMTNGWRNFNWEKLRNAPRIPQLQYPPETDYMRLTGKVYGLKPGTSAVPPQLNFILVGKDSSRNIVFAPVDKNGNFDQKGVFFYDTAKVYYTFNGNNKLSEVTQVQVENGLLRQVMKNTQIEAKDPNIEAADSLQRLKLDAYFAEQEKLRKLQAAATLSEVTVKAKTKTKAQEMDERYTSGLFAGGDGYSFDLTEDKFAVGAQDIFSYLQGKVAGLTINGSGSQRTLSWRGSSPDLYLNEMRSDVEMLQGVPVSDIALIKVFRPPFFGSAGSGAGGAIAIYLKRGADGRKADPGSKGMESTVLGGYSKFREFYSPSYETPPANFEPDVRSTIYWNPYILTNKKNPRVKLEFYNNDITKKFKVVVEGINEAGRMIRYMKIIE